MKQKSRLLPLVAMIVIALVIGSLVLRQVSLRPHEDLLPTASASPTSEITPDINITMGAEAALLSQAVGNALQETAEGAETILTATPTPTLCPPNDGSLRCPWGIGTSSPVERIIMLMASAEGTQLYRLKLTATALAINLTATQPSLTPTSTPTAQGTPCAFMWAHQDLPDVTQAAQKALTDAGADKITVIRAEAYGETCGSSFGAITTDFYLNVAATDLNDNDELAHVIVTAYKILSALDVSMPAAPGYLDIQFTANGTTRHFRALFSQVEDARKVGKDTNSMAEMGIIH